MFLYTIPATWLLFQCMMSQPASCTQLLCAGQSRRHLCTVCILGSVCCGGPLPLQIWCLGLILVLPWWEPLHWTAFLTSGGISWHQPLPLTASGTFYRGAWCSTMLSLLPLNLCFVSWCTLLSVCMCWCLEFYFYHWAGFWAPVGPFCKYLAVADLLETLS